MSTISKLLNGGQPQRFGNLVVMLYQRFTKETPELFALTINAAGRPCLGQ